MALTCQALVILQACTRHASFDSCSRGLNPKPLNPKPKTQTPNTLHPKPKPLNPKPAGSQVEGIRSLHEQIPQTQRVLSTHMGNTYPNHKGNYYYRNHTLHHIGTLDPLGKHAFLSYAVYVWVHRQPGRQSPNFDMCLSLSEFECRSKAPKPQSD